MKMARMENKRISNNSLELRTPQPSLLKNTSSVLKWRVEREWARGLKGRRKSILNISFQSNVNNLCCLCFLLLLFIYLLLSFQQPAHFSKASWTGKLYQTFEFSFKRLSPCLFIYFSFFTLVLLLFGEANTWSFDEKQTWHVFFSGDPEQMQIKRYVLRYATLFFLQCLLSSKHFKWPVTCIHPPFH